MSELPSKNSGYLELKNLEGALRLRSNFYFYIILTVFVIGIISATVISKVDDDHVRQPVVAGQFYPAAPDQLRSEVESFLQKAERESIPGRIYGIITPHAGYVFSGQTAAVAYKQVAGVKYDMIVILAPSHRDPFRGATIFAGDAYKTPLGLAKVNKQVADQLTKSNNIRFSELGHRAEHSLEVQLPFIQILFPNTTILPIVVGGYDAAMCKEIGTTLANALAGKRSLIVASSDLYHGYSYEECQDVDKATLDAITAFTPSALCRGLLDETYKACGGGPITIMQEAVKRLGADKAKVVARTNSGDITGQKGGYIVGYGAVVFYGSEEQTSDHQIFEPLDVPVQKELLRMARQAIAGYLKTGSVRRFKPKFKVMEEKRGVFVTITKNGALRGCIGYHEADNPLYELVPDRAVAAAFKDPRFRPLNPDELDQIKIKISVYLTNVYKIDSLDEFKMGEHGIIMVKNGRGATYLPEVPIEVGWTSVEQEMESLCQKAGLPIGAWRSGAEFWIYRTQVFDESIL